MRFVRILAGRTGQELNLSAIGEACGIAHNTVKEWLSVLVCHLLGIRKKDEIDYHFLKGSLFETFIVSEFLKYSLNNGDKYQLFYWRDNHQKKIDLILDYGTAHLAVEIKSSRTLQEKYLTALKDWHKISGTPLSSLFLLYGGDENMVRSSINVVSWKDIRSRIIDLHL